MAQGCFLLAGDPNIKLLDNLVNQLQASAYGTLYSSTKSHFAFSVHYDFVMVINPR